MKSKNFILALGIALVFLSISLISATVTVNYNTANAILENNDALNITSAAPLTGVSVVGYVCADVGCTTIGAQVAGLTVAASGTSVVSVIYPNALISSNGYVLYFSRPGYIGWEQFANWSSPDNGNYVVNSNQTIYLTQKRSGFAPIMNLSVVEEIPTGRPIRIGFNVSIDADTYAAIEDSRVSNIPLNENVQTLVTLEIRNASNGLIYTSSQTVNIPYSSSVPVNFDYTGFSNTGDYIIRVFTDVTDAKILSSIRQQAQSGITVIPQNLTNYTFTLIQNLNMVPALPIQNTNVIFSFNYNSGFVDDNNLQFPANTTLNMTIYRNAVQIWNNLVNAGSSGSYTFNRVFNDTGNYRLLIIGSPNDNRGNLTIPSSQEMTFVISATPSNETINDGDSHTGSTVSGIDKNKIQFDTGTPENESVIDLTQPDAKISSAKKLIFWLLFLIILLIIAIVAVYYFKR